MEVVAVTPSGSGMPPIHNHDVREWSRTDSFTGIQESARLESDHWVASTTNSSHKYGKVVDSRARSNADGVVQQRAKRQLEVFQSNVPGGRLQVIKSHVVASSRWTNKSPTTENKGRARHFEDFELSLNPLDARPQISDGIVEGDVGRCRPSRRRGQDDISISSQHNSPSSPLANVQHTAAVNLHRVSRLCHQVHENAVKQTIGKSLRGPPIRERESGDGIETIEIESINSFEDENPKQIKDRANLFRMKSTSNEDLNLLTPDEGDISNKSSEDLEDFEQLQGWRRTSKIRRSLPFSKQNKTSTSTKPLVPPENSRSVHEIREDVATGRRLNTALRGNNVNLEALDQIFQSIPNSSSSERISICNDKYEPSERIKSQINTSKQKRNSFVTVESLQEVKGRLRRRSSLTEDICRIKCIQGSLDTTAREEETDDGIVTEESNFTLKHLNKMPINDLTTTQSRVRSYVYGMETMINKKSVVGTGSLESRKQFNGASACRNEDWYNRRKSYGFEQVHNHQESISSSSNKNLIDSSTDSGICRSAEIVIAPTTDKSDIHLNKSIDYNSPSENEKNDNYVLNKNDHCKSEDSDKILNVGSIRRYTSSIFEQAKANSPISNKRIQNQNNLWKQQDDRISSRSANKDFDGTAVTIPIVPHNSHHYNTQQPTGINMFSDGIYWTSNYNQNHLNTEIKRHSIAVDESKYITSCSPEITARFTNFAVNNKNTTSSTQFLQDGLEDDISQSKKQKKVEFCKTEVHFAAESGKVNIVATDEKPPPTNNFRRRRRNSLTLYNQFLNNTNKSDLPMLHFGESSYEKRLVGADQETDALNVSSSDIERNMLYNKQLENEIVTNNTVTVSTNNSYQNYQFEVEDEQKENLENEAPKGILKNKPIKPKPYLLGDDNFFKQNSSNGRIGVWGVNLKPVHNTAETPMWKSTVTLKNTLYDQPQNESYFCNKNSNQNSRYINNKQVPENSAQPEFQKLLKNLRPIRKHQDPEKNQHISKHNDEIRYPDPENDSKRSSWSVSDIVQSVEAIEKSDIKGFSTKVNIGHGEATVIEDQVQERNPAWPKSNDTRKGLSDLHLNLSHNKYDEVNTESSSFLSEKSKAWEKQQNYVKTTNINRNPGPTMVLQKSHCDTRKLNASSNTEKLSSPSLVEQNIKSGSDNKFHKQQNTSEASSLLRHKKDFYSSQLNEKRTSTPTKEQHQRYSLPKQNDKQSPLPAKYSPVRQIEKHSPSPPKDEHTHISVSKHKGKRLQLSVVEESAVCDDLTGSVRQKSPSRAVLRNPRKSEMAYFGVKTSPSPKATRKSLESTEKKNWESKSNSLQQCNTKEIIKYLKEAKSSSPNKHSAVSSTKQTREPLESPIYQNIEEARRQTDKFKTTDKEFDSSILDELTKAADQILQAVNGYAEDHQKRKAKEEKKTKSIRKEKLDTISETKSWRHTDSSSKYRNSSHKNGTPKPKSKHNSSASSVESITEHRKLSTPIQKATTDNEKYKKKIACETTSSRAVTKARRLQRASSREALLKSHESSSEDLPVIEVPLRKPRTIKKIKSTHVTPTNTIEVSRSSSSTSKKHEKKNKTEDRTPVRALPEIQHKAVISKIRSTQEKHSHDRSHRTRSEERKKDTSSKKDVTRLTLATKSERSPDTSSTNLINQRISTTSVRKCSKYKGSRDNDNEL